MFEHKSQPLLSHTRFIKRLFSQIAFLFLLIVLSLVIGTLGYKATEGLSWIDSFYNASLIMSGMGPARELQTDSAKIFASFYSIYSGLFLIAAAGLLLAPIFHRVLHTFHAEKQNTEKLKS